MAAISSCNNATLYQIFEYKDLSNSILSILDWKDLINFEEAATSHRKLTSYAWQNLRIRENYYLNWTNSTEKTNYIAEKIVRKNDITPYQNLIQKNSCCPNDQLALFLQSHDASLNTLSQLSEKQSGEFYLMTLSQLKNYQIANDFKPLLETTSKALEKGYKDCAHLTLKSINNRIPESGLKIIFQLAESGDYHHLIRLVQKQTIATLESFLNQGYNYPPILAKLGDLYLPESTAKADQLFTKMIQKHPHQLTLTDLNLAACAKLKLGLFKESLHIYLRMIELAREQNEPDSILPWFDISYLYAALNDWHQAEVCITKAWEFDQNLQYLPHYAWIKFKRGNLKMAYQIVNQFIHEYDLKTMPPSQEMLTNLGTILIEARDPQAAELFNFTFSIYPDFSEQCLREAIRAHFMIRNYRQCNSHLQALMNAFGPNTPADILHDAATVKFMLNQIEEANTLCQKARLAYEIENIPVPFDLWKLYTYTMAELGHGYAASTLYFKALAASEGKIPFAMNALQGFIYVALKEHSKAFLVLESLIGQQVANKEKIDADQYLKSAFKAILFPRPTLV